MLCIITGSYAIKQSRGEQRDLVKLVKKGAMPSAGYAYANNYLQYIKNIYTQYQVETHKKSSRICDDDKKR